LGGVRRERLELGPDRDQGGVVRVERVVDAGLALLALVLRWEAANRLLTPLRVLGGNAILAFLFSTLMSRVGLSPLLPEAGQRVPPQLWGFEMALSVLKEPHLASLACAFGVLAMVTIAIWPLHRRAIHVRL